MKRAGAKPFKHPLRPCAGFALIATLLMLAVLTALLGAYLTATRIELATLKSSRDSSSGFYAAEGGLNIRAEAIRALFVGYNTPSGTSPVEPDPCAGTNLGSGDFECQTVSLNGREVVSYIINHQAGGDPQMIKIPQGELYQNLNAQEYRYTANSTAFANDGAAEAILQLRFKSRLVPLFQFAVFYNKDLEINPGPVMTLSGPVHTNGDLYLDAGTSLDINGQVTSAGNIYRGRKDNSQNPNCKSNPNRIKDPTNPRSLIPSCNSRVLVTENDVLPFNGMVQFGVSPVTVPEPEVLDPSPGRLYWDKADLRIVLNVDASLNPVTTYVSSGIEVRNQDNSVNTGATNTLFGCAGAVRRNPAGGDNNLRAAGTSYAFKNNRENKTIRMLDIDLRGVLACLHNSNWFGSGKQLNDASEGGLVFFFTVQGPHSSSAANAYGTRLANAAELAGPSGAPAIRGLTVVTDQAIYVQGNFNSTNKKPAAVLADSFNVLSNYWYDTSAQNFRDSLSLQPVSNRPASATTQNMAVLAGTDTTGGVEGSGGQGGSYNGGLENYPRFHENWTGITYTYRGSFVSLSRPRHVNGAWVYGQPQYTAPNRNWDYDTSFNNAANLPPVTPRFVYLRQELFVRDWEQ